MINRSRIRSICGAIWNPFPHLPLYGRIGNRFASHPMIVGGIIFLVITLSGIPNPWSFYKVVFSIGFPFVAVGLGLALFAFRQVSSLAKQHDYELCLNCKYPLDTLPDTGKCPECGDDYTQDEIRKFWMENYNWPKKKKSKVD